MTERLGRRGQKALRLRRRNEEGFTLFELLIVIIILAILAAIVAFSVGTSSASAMTSTCQSDAKAFASARRGVQVGCRRIPW